MNNKKQDKKPLFAEVNLTGDEFRQSPSNHFQRTRLRAAALRIVLGDKQTFVRMCQNSRKLFEEQFTIKMMINRLVKLYKSLV